MYYSDQNIRNFAIRQYAGLTFITSEMRDCDLNINKKRRFWPELTLLLGRDIRNGGSNRYADTRTF